MIEQISSDGQAWIWAATDRGLARIDEQQFDLIEASTRVADSGYRGVVIIEREGRSELWASSIRQGIIRMDISAPLDPVLIEDDHVPDPPDPTVYSVLPDSQGRIYVCTNNGVQLLEPTSGGVYHERVFRRRDGLVHDECNSYSQVVDHRDRYWVGTLAGLSVYDPDLKDETSTSHPGSLHVTELRLDSSPLRTTPPDRLIVPAGTRELQVHFFTAQQSTRSRQPVSCPADRLRIRSRGLVATTLPNLGRVATGRISTANRSTKSCREWMPPR